VRGHPDPIVFFQFQLVLFFAGLPSERPLARKSTRLMPIAGTVLRCPVPAMGISATAKTV
jgi:hypothetical protein